MEVGKLRRLEDRKLRRLDVMKRKRKTINHFRDLEVYQMALMLKRVQHDKSVTRPGNAFITPRRGQHDKSINCHPEPYPELVSGIVSGSIRYKKE